MVLHTEVMEHMFPTAFVDHSPMWAQILELQIFRTRDSGQRVLFQGPKFVGCVLAAKGGLQKKNKMWEAGQKANPDPHIKKKKKRPSWAI